MNNRRGTIGVAAACLALFVLAGCDSPDSQRQRRITDLAPCTASGSVFAQLPLEEWPKRYHDGVRDVVDAHIESIGSVATMELQCTDSGSVVPASQALRMLASEIPAWQSAARMAQLSEQDAPAVLLEFLRVYECSLNEHRHHLPFSMNNAIEGLMSWGDLRFAQDPKEELIAHELSLSRTALDRTLGVIAGYDRLRPLATDLECVKRASLDLRNVLGLAAEASACLPRAWDPHTSLRDLP